MRIDLVSDLSEGAEMLGERLEKTSGKTRGDIRNADGTKTSHINSMEGLAAFLGGRRP